MKSESFLTASVLLLAVSRPAAAGESVIEMFNLSFLPQTVEVDLGDTVSWVWRRGEHTVTSGTGPGDPGAGAIFDVPLDAANPSFTFLVREGFEAGVPFFCRNHPEQIGFIEISSGELTFRVGVVDNAFIPEVLHIFAGDSVRWEHERNEDYHTVTSGLSSLPEDDPGALFDVESSDFLPIFVYRFESSTVLPYFCRPHETMGMTGVIYVQEKFVRGDVNGDLVVDVSDAVSLLLFLFGGGRAHPCLDALDANDDGEVNLSDAIFTLDFLFRGGAEIPRPFPRLGADRTPDGLECWKG
jgi:plastocyanin